jgi:hypothetical protein
VLLGFEKGKIQQNEEALDENNNQHKDGSSQREKPKRRSVGERKPKRDSVGDNSDES